MLEIMLLDDDPEMLKRMHRETETELAENGFSADWYEATDPESAKAVLEQTDKLDLALLDIDMGNGRESGLELASLIREQYPSCSIVFVTSYLSFATEIYEVQPIYFILKEQFREKLSKAISIFIQIQTRRQQYLKVSKGKTEKLIPVDSILYLERENRRSKIVTENEETVVWDNLGKLFEQLPPERFAICHKSYIVGLRWVANYDRFNLTLSTGQVLPISRSQRESFRKSLARFMISDM